MKYHIGDKFLIADIEAKVAFVSSSGKAYLVPEQDGLEYETQKTLIGVVFTVLDIKGVDKLGNRAIVINNSVCGAV